MPPLLNAAHTPSATASGVSNRNPRPSSSCRNSGVVSAVFAQPGQAEARFYEKGAVRIRFQEAGAGFPLLLIPGGGLSSTMSFFTRNAPFNAIAEFKDEYRCITADLRNANPGQSTGPL